MNNSITLDDLFVNLGVKALMSRGWTEQDKKESVAVSVALAELPLHIYLLQGGINALGVNLLKNATVWLNDLVLLQKVNDFLNYPSRESGISVLNELNKIKVKNCLSNKD